MILINFFTCSESLQKKKSPKFMLIVLFEMKKKTEKFPEY